MKKWIIGCIILLLAAVILVVSGQSASELIEETVIVRYESFEANYKTLASVQSDSAYLYYSGNVTKVVGKVGQKVEDGDVILEYEDYDSKKKSLKSTTTGYLLSVGEAMVEISETPFYLQCYLPWEIVSQLKEGQMAVYQNDEDLKQAEITFISEVGVNKNGQTLYLVELSFDDELTLYQQVTLTFQLEQQDGYVVAKEAILSDEDGYYLLKSGYFETLSNIEDYRIDINVLLVNDSDALSEGVQLLDEGVCVFTSGLQEVLLDD